MCFHRVKNFSSLCKYIYNYYDYHIFFRKFKNNIILNRDI